MNEKINVMIDKTIKIDQEVVDIFGIRFLNRNFQTINKLLVEGSFMIIPSAPSLTYLKSDPYYYECLKGADFAIPDSGLMVLILRFFYKINIQKLSGLAFLKQFLIDCADNKNHGIFFVEPTQEDHEANENYLNNIGVFYDSTCFYVAPLYKDTVIEDFDLLKQLEEQMPKYIIINLGGGIQEKLGYFLKKNLSYKPAIICTGAAIAFLSGRQANIPDWGDKFYLGWLFRCLSNPRRFVPRYLDSIKLVFMLLCCTVEKSN